MGIEAHTLSETFDEMKAKLGEILPLGEIRYKAELAFEINQLKRERGAVILGHNYMEPALFYSVTDFVGDSLELSRKAATVEADPIIFCGVRFMAETAKILNPTRTVLLPARVAGCSLASSITAEDVRRLKREHPGVPVATYVNTYADVKAESDVCVTSGNAAHIISSLPGDTVLFLPDEYLAKNVAKETGKTILFPENAPQGKRSLGIIGWHGACEVHERFSLEDIANIRSQFPDAIILAHPECTPEVVEASDFAGSTSRMIQFVKQSSAKRFALLTECSMGDNIAADNPDKELIRICSIRCPHMNEITLEDTLHALRHNEQVIEVEESVRIRAKRALDRMLEMSPT